MAANAQEATRRRRTASIVNESISSMTLVAPVAALLGIFFVWPMADLLIRSLRTGGVRHIGNVFANYESLVHDPVLLLVLKNTVVIAFWSTLVTGILAIPVAYLLTRVSARVRAIVVACIAIPFLVSILIRLFSFTIILGSNGLINRLLNIVHIGRLSLIFNTTGTVIGMVNYLLPYMVLMVYSGMAGVDNSLMTAAKSLGASNWRAAQKVYLPLISATLVSTFLLVFVLGLGFFLTPAVLGGPTGTPAAVYIQAQINDYQWGTASAMGIVLLAVSLIGYVMVLRVSGLGAISSFAGGAASKGANSTTPLRKSWLSMALWFVTFLVLVILIVPLVVAVGASFSETQTIVFPPHGFTLRWYGEVFSDPIWKDAIEKSIGVAIGTGTLAAVLGLAFARFTLRRKTRASRTVLLVVAYCPLIVPLILLSIGNYDVQVKLGLIGSWWGLIFIHTVMAFPFAVAILFSGLGGVDQNLESAAWTLGASRLRAFWKVTARAAMPSIVGAWLISFLISWDEIVVALFQTGFHKTLPVVIYSYLQSGLRPTVAAVAAMLIGLTLVTSGAFALVRLAQSRWSHSEFAFNS